MLEPGSPLLTDGKNKAGDQPWQQRLFVVIFKAETTAGKLFDICLIAAIVASVLLVVMDSVGWFHRRYGDLVYWLEWSFTILFTIEYLLRLLCVQRTVVYARSFFGIVDLIAILPSYLELMLTGQTYLRVVRLLRILRAFRILKLSRYLGGASMLVEALKASRYKIAVFIYTVATLVVLFGSLMYVVEGEQHGFDNIPKGIYWSIVTLTTVGYGDITPHTPLGQAIAGCVMIMGYGIIAVPTGIFAAELGHVMRQRRSDIVCGGCGSVGHNEDAAFCRRCGHALE